MSLYEHIALILKQIKNALNEYNALMDIMYVDEEKVRFYLLFVSFYLFT